jgi:hypothetical protein
MEVYAKMHTTGYIAWIDDKAKQPYKLPEFPRNGIPPDKHLSPNQIIPTSYANG